MESYLKEHNLGIFAPYLAENHANSPKPITVSFDPLDDSKESNYGYKLIPKAGSAGSSANMGGIDAPMNWDDYELIRIDDIDDDYAMDNPTLAIIEIDYNGSGNYGSTPPNTTLPSNVNPIDIPTNGIDCDNLLSTDILRPYMQKFRLTDNLRSGFWNQNLLDLYAVTADDVSFDVNDVATVNSSSTKWWSGVKVSRKDAKDKKWTLDETNLVLVVAYKKSSVDLTVSTDVSGIFDGDPKVDIGAELKLEDKRELLTNYPLDKCDELKLFNSPSPVDPNNEKYVYKARNLEYTLDMIWYR